MATGLESGAELQLPGLRRAAAHLGGLLGPRADIGSGPGVMTCVLAEAFAGAATVAVDATPGLLDRVRARAGKLGPGDRVAVRHAYRRT
ncbi:class I SAM-dependent methyltransferase [Streptomyces flavotricini]|uniref:Class I SAM-dependent methyltransferase n=1 Tax=Streptomyces flavotricini TaxID=66888 RepID=A0ABS8DYS8_9ACTN|nr:class I SAM-dependent methyltransferase [Streptomyces flavotricini]MCC0093868.1 class I SAM-dependent methyltransferase [Streptomyces flavotricini]